jgi:ATP-dependent RNA helicase DeaD
VAYRIAVGRRHKVQPGQIVGAIANEGGLSRGDFGHIDIQLDHTIVELPADLGPEVFDALAKTRISGQLIGLQRADGASTAPSTQAASSKKPHRKGPAKPKQD